MLSGKLASSLYLFQAAASAGHRSEHTTLADHTTQPCDFLFIIVDVNVVRSPIFDNRTKLLLIDFNYTLLILSHVG